MYKKFIKEENVVIKDQDLLIPTNNKKRHKITIIRIPKKTHCNEYFTKNNVTEKTLGWSKSNYKQNQ